ncbi:MAG TPA: DUF2971 domain-containing protein [Gallionellaceae bacterium]|nr:DUF2971 domain-containing protein [Gallionellaceae bacterium]
MGKISDSHKELYHYTTAAGLSGILESKSLRATHSSFMNDEEEIHVFYDRVLPEILRPNFRKYFEEIKDKPDFRTLQGNTPFNLYLDEQFTKLIQTLKVVSLGFHDQYITSFTTTTDPYVHDNGLLSQWRAYGTDGGYAIVLDTDQLDKILSEETTPYYEEIFSWADVQYHPIENGHTNDPDTNEWIVKLQVAADKYFRSGFAEDASEFSNPLAILSSFFKHRGFSEEQEVRLVLSLLGPKLESHLELQSVQQHPIKTTVREGATVPFVELCIRNENGVRQHLPIARIIVGPHRDKNDRKRAVQLLLKQHGLSDLIDKVSVSDIPYRGR